MAAGDTNVTGAWPSRSRQQASNASAQRAEWNPHAPLPAKPASSSEATASGRVASSCGEHHGVWRNAAVRRSGRRAASMPGTNASW